MISRCTTSPPRLSQASSNGSKESMVTYGSPAAKKDKYLGMDINYSVPGKFTFSMDKYSCNIINEFPEDLGKTAKTPAGQHLFIIRDDDTCRPLPENQAQIFHYTIAQILFIVT